MGRNASSPDQVVHGKIRCPRCRHRAKVRRIVQHMMGDYDITEAAAYTELGLPVPNHATSTAPVVVVV